MATATDSDTTGGQFDERVLDYLDRRSWVRTFHVMAWICAVGMYPTFAVGASDMGNALAVIALAMMLIARAYSTAGYANSAYNMTIGRLVGPIDETAEDMRGEIEWQ